LRGSRGQGRSEKHPCVEAETGSRHSNAEAATTAEQMSQRSGAGC
jgi:hypothetical protein